MIPAATTPESPVHALLGVVYRGAIEAKRALWDSGWARSRFNMRAQTRDGKPLPWLTYPAIHWLEETVKPNWHVFEWGSGQSTRWFLKRGCRATSVEHDRDWFVSEGMFDDVLLRSGKEFYVRELDTVYPYDLVLIDGAWRAECVERALSIKPFRVMLDNSDQYQAEKARLATGYKHAIPFKGLTPAYKESETMLFLEPKGGL